MNKPSVDPTFTFGVSLIVSLVLWYPTLRATMAGNIDITDAGIRYFIALALSWAGVYGVSAIVAMYAANPRLPTPPPPGKELEGPARGREDIAPEPVEEDIDATAA